MTHTISIEFKSATGVGDLDGWESFCSCGDRASFSIKSMTNEYAHDHVAYMTKKEAGH